MAPISLPSSSALNEIAKLRVRLPAVGNGELAAPGANPGARRSFSNSDRRLKNEIENPSSSLMSPREHDPAPESPFCYYISGTLPYAPRARSWFRSVRMTCRIRYNDTGRSARPYSRSDGSNEIPLAQFNPAAVPQNVIRVAQWKSKLGITKFNRTMKGGFANAHFQVRQVRMEQGNS